MLGDIERAKIVITNYHALRRRERIAVSKTGRALLEGHGPKLETIQGLLWPSFGDKIGDKTHFI